MSSKSNLFLWQIGDADSKTNKRLTTDVYSKFVTTIIIIIISRCMGRITRTGAIMDFRYSIKVWNTNERWWFKQSVNTLPGTGWQENPTTTTTHATVTGNVAGKLATVVVITADGLQCRQRGPVAPGIGHTAIGRANRFSGACFTSQFMQSHLTPEYPTRYYSLIISHNWLLKF